MTASRRPDVATFQAHRDNETSMIAVNEFRCAVPTMWWLCRELRRSMSLIR
ncbi:hypothetical protein [Rhodococcus sp. LB1]|uniref:hypothetical protein n=1 Tax=Rhodococcus sp. LB1 TaxID=1807499 RepID=UPI000AC7C0BF|nr:hypothetical protein [Rhodococcus sp. LB1]